MSKNKEGKNTRTKEINQKYIFSLKILNHSHNDKFQISTSFPPLKCREQHVIYKSVPIIRGQHHQLMNLFHLEHQGPDEPIMMIGAALTLGKLRDQMLNEPQEFFIPKPRFTKCHLCNIEFQDYLSHVKTQQHLEKQNKNPCNEYMVELRKKLNDQNPEKVIKNGNNHRDMGKQSNYKLKTSFSSNYLQNQTFLDGIQRDDLFSSSSFNILR